MSEHTKGVLACYNDEVFLADDDSHVIAHVLTSGYETDRLVATDARRIAACWNALANVGTEWLESNKSIVVLGAPIADRFRELEAERDELLDACKKALYALKGREHDQFLRDAIDKAEAKKP